MVCARSRATLLLWGCVVGDGGRWCSARLRGTISTFAAEHGKVFARAVERQKTLRKTGQRKTSWGMVRLKTSAPAVPCRCGDGLHLRRVRGFLRLRRNAL